jgi:hypothetical protein
MRAAGAVALAALATACSAASTTTVAIYQGNYNLWIVAGTNGCDLPGISEGQTTSMISLAVVQGTDAGVPQNMTVTVGGAAGTQLTNLVGTNVLVGTLGGSQVTLTPGPFDGGPPDASTDAGCTYTTNVSVSLNFGGDTVEGTFVYQDATNGVTACGSLRTCQTVLAVAGVLAQEAGAPPQDSGPPQDSAPPPHDAGGS